MNTYIRIIIKFSENKYIDYIYQLETLESSLIFSRD